MLRRTCTFLVAVGLVLAGCSSSDDGAAPTTTSPTLTVAPAGPLEILVTNDDGIAAPGIDALVNALGQIPDVEVHVVAPAENQSGSSDKTTPGGAAYADSQTASGVAGTAVDGFPADAVAVALDDLGLTPDLVVSGINKGQNVGPLAYESGTVGAGRAAVRRGIPAIAGSAGFRDDPEGYAAAAELVVGLIEDSRADYASDAATADAVVSVNVPDCTAGTIKDAVEVPLAAEIPEGVNPFESDCTVEPAQPPADDVAAIVAGYATITLVAPEAPTA